MFEREWGERNRERDWVLNIGTLQKGYVGACKIPSRYVDTDSR